MKRLSKLFLFLSLASTAVAEETWVTVTEWMQPAGVEKFGSDNSVFVAKLKWNRPNHTIARANPADTIKPYFAPPQAWQGKLGNYRSPLEFADGTKVHTPAAPLGSAESFHRS